tara:strand:- start:26987 stop:27199 length:213 start_codon:yes stop_codon:yes gene_type:complete
MFKVVVILCALNLECYMFVEKPPKFYEDVEECLVVAKQKYNQIVVATMNNGYTIEDARYTCDLVNSNISK